MMVGILPGSTAPDVWNTVCHFNRVNKDDIQWRGKRNLKSYNRPQIKHIITS